MTFEEALLILGIEATCDEKQARRAYLRLIKVHTPERDPEGFKRTRQAFEAVTASSYRLGASQQPPCPEAGPRAIPPAPNELETLRQNWWLDDPAERSTRAREAARRLDSEESYQLWLDVAEQDDEQRAVLQEGLAHGHTRLRSQLRERFPESLSASELDAWRDELQAPPYEYWTVLARELVRRGQPELALELALRCLAHADHAHTVGRWFYNGFALSLFASRDPLLGRRFVTACESLAVEVGSFDSVQAALLRELSQVSDRLEPHLCRDIAEALSKHEPSDADSRIEMYASHERPRGALRALLQAEAPTLFGLYEPLLPRRWLPKLPTPNKSWGQGLWIAGILSVQLFRHCESCETSETPRPAVIVREIEMKMGSESEDWSQFRCAPADDRLCEVALLLWSTVECADQRHLMQEFETLLAEAQARGRLGPEERRPIAIIREHAWQQCGTGKESHEQ